MAQTDIDELTQADEAFAGNRLLSTFSREARALIEPFGEMVELAAGDTCSRRGDQVAIQPVPDRADHDLDGQSSCRAAAPSRSRRSGREGAVGGIVSCGHAPAFSRADVLVGGPAFAFR